MERAFLDETYGQRQSYCKNYTPKTGVKIDIKWVNGTENEQLVRIFSTGRNMPDVIMSPYWGGGDSCSDTIRKAAKDGLLLPLDDLIADYAPNLTGAFTEGVAKNFVQNELSQPEFDGKNIYFPCIRLKI